MTDLPTPPRDHRRVPPPQTHGKGFVHVEMVDDSGHRAEDPGDVPDADPDPAGDASREWDLGLLFTVASGGRLFHDVTGDGMSDLCALLHHLTGHGVMTVHLADACDAARDHVREHLVCWPDVAAVLTGPDAMSRDELLVWLDTMRERFGAGQAVPAMPSCEWVPESALRLLADAFGVSQTAAAVDNAARAAQHPDGEPQWSMGCVLQVAIGGRMVVDADSFAELHALLCHLTTTEMIMVSFEQAADAVREHVRGQLPWLAEAEQTLPPVDHDDAAALTRAWLGEVEREHGTRVRVDPSGEAHPNIGPGTSDTETIIAFIAGQERN